MKDLDANLKQTLADLEEDRFHDLFKQALEAGKSPVEILETLRKGMEVVGQRFEDKEYFLTDLIMAAELFKVATNQLEPRLADQPVSEESAGTIVFGTVQGDIHDIGKDIVVAMLRGSGFTVHDLGVDVPPESFVEKVQESGATIVGMTGLITMSYDSMKATVDALEKAGLRDDVKIMIGGGMVNEKVLDYTGADEWGLDVREAVHLARKFVQGKPELEVA